MSDAALSDETKPWYLSRGVVGSLVGAGATLVSLWFHFTIDQKAASELADIIIGLVTLISALVSWYGRVMATQKIDMRLSLPPLINPK